MRQSRQMRHVFFAALVRQVRVVWPILSGIILLMIASGLAVASLEDWSIDEALYFTFVTGLTIGYGDFAPHHFLARLLAIVVGLAGIIMTGLVAAVSVQALRETNRDEHDNS